MKVNALIGMYCGFELVDGPDKNDRLSTAVKVYEILDTVSPGFYLVEENFIYKGDEQKVGKAVLSARAIEGLGRVYTSDELKKEIQNHDELESDAPRWVKAHLAHILKAGE